MTDLVKRLPRNTAGRDFIVGDLHGMVHLLTGQLHALGFEPARDRLIFVGDLVDRGPLSPQAVDLLSQPWVHSVMGNHEQMAVFYVEGRLARSDYAHNGGSWLIGETIAEQVRIADALRDLPLAIELETAEGLVGIVHAECPLSSWPDLIHALQGPRHSRVAAELADAVLWSRRRYMDWYAKGAQHPVSGVHAVVCGHTGTENGAPQWVGNTLFIDTGACFTPGRLTIIDAATLAEAI